MGSMDAETASFIVKSPSTHYIRRHPVGTNSILNELIPSLLDIGEVFCFVFGLTKLDLANFPWDSPIKL